MAIGGFGGALPGLGGALGSPAAMESRARVRAHQRGIVVTMPDGLHFHADSPRPCTCVGCQLVEDAHTVPFTVEQFDDREMYWKTYLQVRYDDAASREGLLIENVYPDIRIAVAPAKKKKERRLIMAILGWVRV